MITKAEYLWIDGCKPTAKLRSKTKIIESEVKDVADIPEWGFDGSSTMQAEGHFSDCLLKPVSFLKDPIRGGNDIIVMCEVFNADGTVHESNHRAKLREVAEKCEDEESWFEAIKSSKHLKSAGAWYTMDMGNGKEVKFQPSRWKDKIKEEDFKARVLEIMDEEVILRFDKRDGDAAEFYDIEEV